MLDAVANAAEVVAAVLAIAVTVVAIIVELAATRYNHRITSMFVREPRNLAVLSFFVLTTLCCLWVTAYGGAVPQWVATLAMMMVTCSLLMLLPYFVYVFAFISPINILNRIKRRVLKGVQMTGEGGQAQKLDIAIAIDEITDATNSAINQADRSIAIAGVRALIDILSRYQVERDRLPATWYQIDKELLIDPDFASLESSAIEELETDRAWLEAKVMRRLTSIFDDSIPGVRDVASAISIDVRKVMRLGEHVQRMGVRAFNSFLRLSINAEDPRTSYYVLNQYRLAAQDAADPRIIKEVAGFIKFYGQLAHAKRQPFLLEVAANELAHLIEATYENDQHTATQLLSLVLELDESALTETQEASLSASHELALIGVRRAQLQLTTFFLLREDEPNVERLMYDLKGERADRLLLLRRQIEDAESSHYWELTPRDLNFQYLVPERRALLGEVFERLRIGE